MNRKVITIEIGIPHFYATCYSCSWEYADYNDRETGYREIRKHVSKTGHIVHLEKSVHTDYEPDREKG